MADAAVLDSTPLEPTPAVFTSEPETPDLVTTEVADVELVVRSLEKREIEARIVPWHTVVDTPIGLEAFMPGAFAHVDAKKVVLEGPEHKGVAGRGQWLEERADGAYMGFKVSKTMLGDEILTLANDGVTRHVSVTYDPRNTQAEFQQRGGKRFTALTKVDLRAVATTWKPYYEGAAITQVRAKAEGAPTMSEAEVPAPVETPAPALDITPLNAAIESLSTTMASQMGSFAERMEKLEERSRSNFVIPAEESAARPADRGTWMQAVLRMLSGERIPDMQMRALADLVTTDNVGVVPDTISREIIGVIDPRRPFMQTTRRLATPTTGMSLVVPRIVTRPTVDIQAAEKDELQSTATSVDTVTYDAVSKGGAGDISLQLLKRSDPSFLGLYLELLAEAYALDAEEEAVDALLSATGTVDGGFLDVEDTHIGNAWIGAHSAMKRPPDTIWLSSEAVGAFIDAKATGTNAPLYSQLRADFSVAGGVGGTISGLRPVHVPALDNNMVDVIIGPSQGFAWAEDGTYTLQVDVPAKAGKDVAIIGILWFAPLYPAAFTTYRIAS
jgi:HK97 family phage major capsid protein